MRVKLQAVNSSGLLQDICVDPAKKHMLAMDFTPIDLAYLARLPILIGKRHHLGCIPFRVKVRVLGPDGKLLDVVADRTKGDWIAIELTPQDIDVLTKMGRGKNTRKIVYAGQKGKNAIQAADIEKFKSDWPELHAFDDDMDYERLMTKRIATSSMADAFLVWSHEWPLNFHSTEKAPAPRLVLADDRAIDGKDG